MLDFFCPFPHVSRSRARLLPLPTSRRRIQRRYRTLKNVVNRQIFVAKRIFVTTAHDIMIDMKTIAICDDEALLVRQLHDEIKEYCAQHDIECHICAFSSAEALLADAGLFDLVLLDIQMSGLNGMEAARHMRKRGSDCPIVFISGHHQYVFDAFDVGAVHYLLKPIDTEKLFAVMQGVFSKSEADALLVKQGANYQKIPLGQISYIEVMNRKILIHTPRNVTIFYGRLKELLPRLDHRFFQCHRSFVVNLDMVHTLHHQDAIMDHQERVPVSRDKHKALSLALLQHFRKDCSDG